MNNQPQTPDSSTHFLVSGGGKGITAACVIALAEAFQCRFTIFGRSELLSVEPEWARSAENEKQLKEKALQAAQNQGEQISPRGLSRRVNSILASREIAETMDKVRKAGGHIEYLQLDILSVEALSAALEPITDTVDGLIHGAGALADKHIEDKSEDDLDLVYGVKVGGLFNLLDVIPASNLKFLVLFSSIAGHFGNPGQADYSLSNEILNKSAHHLSSRDPNCRVVALNWGPWEGGMVSPQLKRILEGRGVHLISLEDGPEILVEWLKSDQPSAQLIVGELLPLPPRIFPEERRTYRIRRELTLDKNPFLTDHVIGGKAVLPTVCAVSWLINACENLYPGYQFLSVSDYRVFHGIVFDESLSPSYTAEITELDFSDQGLVFEGKIFSNPPDRNGKLHYQAQIILVKKRNQEETFPGYILTPDQELDGKKLYQDKTLFHGPILQGVKQVINHSPQHLTTRCQLPQITPAHQGQFPIRSFNPYLADVHLQSLLIWASMYLDTVGLPLKIASGHQFSPAVGSEASFATMVVRSKSKYSLKADVISHDAQGLIYSKVRGAEITLSPRLKNLFQQNRLERAAV